VFLVTRAITEHVQAFASSGRVSFALGSSGHQLALTIGPFRAGASQQLQETSESTVVQLADELVSEVIDGSELLRIVLRNHDRDRSAATD